ncbi:MAG: polyprenyl synthetase family protein [Gemmataceae bacterium]|nr:polyprenyl synthetase family protein [Gemmataceae bacterium]
MSFDLPSYLKAKQPLVDGRLAALLDRETAAPGPLADAMRYSLLAPGKRLRPTLVLISSQAAGGSDELALPAACAVEMIHAYSLIHDDLPAMDDDDLRRGLPTCHKQYGEALAILAGDALLTMAFQTLAEHCPPRTAAACCLALAKGAGAAGMVGGQMEDLAWERGSASLPRDAKTYFPGFEQPHSLDALEHIHFCKTGALFRACLQLGVWAAQGERDGGPDPALLARLDEYGRCFGLVFQITDDLLDVERTSAETGKRTNKDATRGKLTYPALLGADESRRRAQQMGRQALEQLTPLGSAGEPLAALVEFALTRDR